MLHSFTARFGLVRVSDKEILLALFCSSWRSAPPPEYWGTVQVLNGDLSLSEDGKYLIDSPFVPTVITVATEGLEKVYSNAQPIKSSCIAPPDMAHELVDVIRAMDSSGYQ
jgi:hypothetical protein